MAEVRYYGLGILAHINNTKKGRVDDHFDINSVLFLFREPDIFLLTRYSPFYATNAIACLRTGLVLFHSSYKDMPRSASIRPIMSLTSSS